MGSTKVEPVSKAVSEEYVSQLGLQYVNYNGVPMYEGRGLKAPMVSQTTSNKGSQGKY
jgi:ABC-type phosphate transport system substrate-binding protein